MTIRQLLKKLEAATAADRDLDGAIAVIVGPWTERHRKPGPWVSKGPHHAIVEAPNFTGSIDAAMTLVPPGHVVAIRSYGDGSFRASVRHMAEPNGEWTLGGESMAPAIPLCIAALKARSLGESQPGETK